MQFVGWMYDIAREQSPREDALREMLARSSAAGYNAVGFYLEHRYAYPSAPWASAPGCLTPTLARRMIRELEPRLRIIPFLNTLGHMEGFIRSEGGQWLAEGQSQGSLQMCPSRPECVEFARGLVADALEVFDDEWVHLGGDETTQLGQCGLCAERAERIGKAGIYAEYFGPLCKWVLERGRRPCLWGDMLIEHPSALEAIPRETVIFDWHYASRPRESTRMFREQGFDVVCCPAVHSFDSAWCFLDLTRENVDQHAEDAKESGALGVLVTTWEFSFFTNYASTLPVIYSAGRRLARGEDWGSALVKEGGEAYARAAEILGIRIPACSSFLKAGTWRKLRDAFVIRQNPFCLWEEWREEACGPVGEEILRLCDEAEHSLERNSPLRFPIELHRVAVEWVRLVDTLHSRYASRDFAGCSRHSLRLSGLLDGLTRRLQLIARMGGSAADVSRHRALKRSALRLRARISDLRQSGAAESQYLPAFETLVHDAYTPGDQAAWRTGHR